jgi:hypothetical protein
MTDTVPNTPSPAKRKRVEFEDQQPGPQPDLLGGTGSDELDVTIGLMARIAELEKGKQISEEANLDLRRKNAQLTQSLKTANAKLEGVSSRERASMDTKPEPDHLHTEINRLKGEHKVLEDRLVEMQLELDAALGEADSLRTELTRIAEENADLHSFSSMRFNPAAPVCTLPHVKPDFDKFMADVCTKIGCASESLPSLVLVRLDSRLKGVASKTSPAFVPNVVSFPVNMLARFEAEVYRRNLSPWSQCLLAAGMWTLNNSVVTTPRKQPDGSIVPEPLDEFAWFKGEYLRIKREFLSTHKLATAGSEHTGPILSLWLTKIGSDANATLPGFGASSSSSSSSAAPPPPPSPSSLPVRGGGGGGGGMDVPSSGIVGDTPYTAKIKARPQWRLSNVRSTTVQLQINFPPGMPDLFKTNFVVKHTGRGEPPASGFWNLHRSCSRGWIVDCTVPYEIALAAEHGPDGPNDTPVDALVDKANAWREDLFFLFEDLRTNPYQKGQNTGLFVSEMYDGMCRLFDEFLEKVQPRSGFSILQEIDELLHNIDNPFQDAKALGPRRVFFIPAGVAIPSGDLSGRLQSPDRSGLYIGTAAEVKSRTIADVN